MGSKIIIFGEKGCETAIDITNFVYAILEADGNSGYIRIGDVGLRVGINDYKDFIKQFKSLITSSNGLKKFNFE
jgi:hypothetical protein